MSETGRKRRGNSRFIFFFILILIVLSSLFWAGYQWLSKADWLTIKNFRITGNENVSSASLQVLIQEFMGENLVKVSSKEITGQLMKIKRIQKITVVRLYPKTLKIKVTERKGFLYLKSCEGDLFPVDEHGMVMEYSVYPSKEDLPVVHTNLPGNQLHAGRIVDDDFLKHVIALQKRILLEKPDFLKSISEYYPENGSVMIVDAKYGTRVLLGTQDLKDQLRRYQFVQENGDVNRRHIFDLRFKNQIVIRQEVQ